MPEPLKTGDVILANVQFTDTFEVKKRPAVVLFEEFDNVVVAGITSNTSMKGIPLSKDDGAIKDCIIKTNYIFTISSALIEKVLFHLPVRKKNELFDVLVRSLKRLHD